MIREGKLEDLTKINELGMKLISNFITTYNIKDYLTNDKYIILVSDVDNINAFLIVLKNIDTYEIEAIYVDNDSRRQGIATKLLFYLEDHYLNKNDTILLEVAVNNENAINLYKKLGFNIINTRHKYYKDIDAYVMKKVKE